MTTNWQVPPDLWAGETVAILGSGPSMSQEVADSVRGLGCKVVALNHTVKLAPWADALFALDPLWYCAGAPDFAGLRVIGCEDENLDALYIGHLSEVVVLSTAPSHIVDIRNNGLSAIRFVSRTGAAKILLYGFEPEKLEHYSPRATSDEALIDPALFERLTLAGTEAAKEYGELYPGLTKGLQAIIAELGAKGIEVVRVEPAAAAVPEAPARRRGRMGALVDAIAGDS